MPDLARFECLTYFKFEFDIFIISLLLIFNCSIAQKQHSSSYLNVISQLYTKFSDQSFIDFHHHDFGHFCLTNSQCGALFLNQFFFRIKFLVYFLKRFKKDLDKKTDFKKNRFKNKNSEVRHVNRLNEM